MTPSPENDNIDRGTGEDTKFSQWTKLNLWLLNAAYANKKVELSPRIFNHFPGSLDFFSASPKPLFFILLSEIIFFLSHN